MGGHEGRVALGAELRHIGAPKEVGHAGPGLGMPTEGLGGEAEDALQGHPDGLVPPLEEGFAHSRGERPHEVLEAPYSHNLQDPEGSMWF